MIYFIGGCTWQARSEDDVLCPQIVLALVHESTCVVDT
jgi:hypothetical protein